MRVKLQTIVLKGNTPNLLQKKMNEELHGFVDNPKATVKEIQYQTAALGEKVSYSAMIITEEKLP
ncbi:MAG: hypothetical protein ABJH72_03975 [Reichenbachiella sp.]|uniref:hypothetical protein n=1 Tax=Reichenbachiella sp. TaxID=2184521 RepID=UPI003298A7CB